MGGIPLSVIWLVLVIVFAIVESATVSLVAIWFAFGSLLAMLAAVMRLSVWVQLILFLAGSLATLWFLREYARKYINPAKVKTNFDRVISMSGVVTEAIDNESGVGQVRVAGQIWSARAEDGAPIPAGTKVVILSIAGVKVIVKRESEQ